MPARDTFVIRGTVRGPHGRPLPGLLVRAFDTGVRQEHALGEATTDADGRYEIPYRTEVLGRLGKLRGDLLIRAYQGATAADAVATSPVVFRARAAETVDLVVDPSPAAERRATEYERHVDTLRPRVQDVPLAELHDEDIGLLAGQTGLSRRNLSYVSQAAAASAKTGIAPDILYACYRQGLPASLPALLLQPAEAIERALARAVRDGVIPERPQDELKKIADSFQALLARDDLDLGSATALLATAPVAPAARQAFLRLSRHHTGQREAFWEAIAREPGVTKADVDDLRFTLQLGLVTSGSAPLVAAARKRGLTSIRDLVALDDAGWRALIEAAGDAALPADLAGRTRDERIAAYIDRITSAIREGFPMERVRQLAVRSPTLDPALGRDLTAFFDAAGDFDLDSSAVDAYVAAHPAATERVADQARLTAHLKTMQRVYRIAPRYEHAQALLDAGLHSAMHVATMSLGRFVEELGDKLGGPDQARMYYARAQQKTAAAAQLFMNAHQALKYPGPAVTWPGKKKAADTLKVVPTLEQLFGSMDFCACDHCRSIYGPAAYFVDLLQFLRKGSTKAFQVLRQRRPDLFHITLNCENTNTPLPYIDLINEVLEAYVHYGNFAAVPPQEAPALAHDTTLSAAELAVNPEHTLEAAYVPLKSAVHTFVLPFDRPLEVVRAYLSHLGSSRHEVMAAFQSGDPAGKTPTDLALSLESLGISPEERTILAGESAEPARAFYGYPSATAPHVNAEGQTITEPWKANLARVPQFLRRTGLAYADVVDLLKTRFVNPIQDTDNLPADAVVLFSPGGSCDLTETWIQHPTSNHQNLDATGLQDARWIRLHRFLRLARKLGWPMQELDQALVALGANDITDEALDKLASLARLRDALALPMDRLLTFWAPIETFGTDALYHRLFLNKAVVNDPQDASFALDAAGTALADATATITAHVPAILAALEIRAADLDALRAATGLADQTEPPVAAPMTLDALSVLFRHATLARALKLKARELVSLKVLTGLDPFPAGDPRGTESFVRRAQAVKASRFTVPQIDYLLRHRWEPPSSPAPLQATVEKRLGALQDDLRKISDETAVAPDPTGDLLRTKLGLAIDGTRVEAAMEVIDGQPPVLAPDKNAFIDDHFGAFLLDLAEAKSLLLDATAGVPARRAYVLPRLLAYLRDRMSRDVTVQTLGQALEMSADLLQPLVTRILPSVQHPQKAAIDDFLGLAGDGLRSEYFDARDLQASTLTRTDPTVAFYWDSDAPASDATPDEIGVRWTGFVVPGSSETYTFYVRANDGVRLWVGDDPQPVIDAWQDRDDAVEHQASVTLEAGVAAAIRLEHYTAGPNGSIELGWSSLSTPKARVPQSRLYSGSPFVMPALVQVFGRLHKLALLTGRLQMTPDELVYVSEHGADFAGFDPGALPLEPTDAQAADRFTQWEALRDLAIARERFPGGDVTLLDVYRTASDPDVPPPQAAATARDRLATVTGWTPGDVELLAAVLAVPDDSFRNAAGVLRLLAAFDLAGRLGLSGQQLRAWAVAVPDGPLANDVVRAVKARYDAAAWLDAARPTSDALRDKQKRALIAYVLATPAIVQAGVSDADGLFEYFLIDVLTAPCMMTSRLKQAISSVQLFIQRCLLNLEPNAPATSIDVDRWAWMKNYRVWEANRKVFLWPENWIVGELRDDKSPFFRELETRLLQNDLTDDHVELALMTYLERVDDVSRLEVAGLYREKEGATDVLHLFARSFNTPRVYYYRRFDLRTERWTAWDRVPVDVEGDHLIPIVWNRRLHLFWATFAEKPDNNKNPSVRGQALPDGAGPFTFWEIKVSWTELRKDGWAAKQSATAALPSKPFWIEFEFGQMLDVWCLPAPRRHYIKAELDGEGLVLTVYRRYDDWSERILADGEFYDPSGIGIPYQGHERVGRIRLTGCRGRAEIEPYPSWEDFDALKGPEETFNVFMGFARTSYNSHLTLADAKHTAVLGTVFDPFTFLHAPSVQDPSKLYYPFFFQDVPRAYLVTPAAQSPIRFSDILAWPDPAIGIQIDVPVTRAPFEWGPQPVEVGTRFPVLDAFRAAAGAKSPAWTAGGVTGDAMLRLSSQPVEGFVPLASMPGEPQMMFMKAGPQIDAGQPAVSTSVAAEIAAALAKGPDKLKFHTFFHPHVTTWIKALNKSGVPGLLTLGNQMLTKDGQNTTVFAQTYAPKPAVHVKHPRENVEFDPSGAFALYNWELFFHVPLLIADRLMQDQRFAEAQQWLHYIFNPTDNSAGEAPARYWKVKPFKENDEPGRIQELLETLNHGSYAAKHALEQAVEEWRDNPFNPHLIARSRLSAYQLHVVMKYLDNLIAWGDQLFARDTLESINEATQIYVLASHLLGRRPALIPPRTKPKALSYDELQPALDAFSNAWVELENLFPSSSVESAPAENGSVGPDALGTTMAFYFCIPPNEKLLAYWDTVEDRLFKIRHCMNIEGVTRQLPLFEPPIDPALLVKATAMGLDIGSVLAEVNGPLPHYRFAVLVQRAVELSADVRGFGAAVLAALEKKDAEALAALRASHETGMLEAAREVRKRQVDETRAQIDALQRTRRVTETRHTFYTEINHRIDLEREQLARLQTAHQLNQLAQMIEVGASAAGGVPNFSFGGAGSMGSPLTSVSFGGGNISAAMSSHARSVSFFAAAHAHQASLASILGGWSRRSAEWKLQARLAARELDQIDRQIAAAEIRLAIAETELANHDRQIEQSREVEAFLRTKYTNADLYGWMQSQLSTVYFQVYKLAYDLAKRAERAYRFELGLSSSNFIQFGYWDNLKRGLLAGERLLLDLKRLESAHLDQNAREHELTKHISIAALNPFALIALRETGRCEIALPESLFDLDYPGHYMRRIKSVSLTVPCIAGPYTGVHGTLTLLSHRVRRDPTAQRPYAAEGDNDTRFASSFSAVQSIATSTAQNDAGLFEVNLRDERYLPFEGAGVESRWRLDMPKDCNAFDFDTITDVVLRLQYTARDGGELLRNAALAAATVPVPEPPPAGAALPPLPAQTGQLRLFSARHDFPTEWHRFLNIGDAQTEHRLVLDLLPERFPRLYRQRAIEITGIRLFLKGGDGLAYVDHASANPPFTLRRPDETNPPGDEFADLRFKLAGSPVAGVPHVSAFGEEAGPLAPGRWEVVIDEAALAGAMPAWLAQTVTIAGETRRRVNGDAVEDLLILVEYSVGAAEG